MAKLLIGTKIQFEKLSSWSDGEGKGEVSGITDFYCGYKGKKVKGSGFI